MDNGSIILQVSHLVYLFSALLAWQKGYKLFSLLLFGMIIVSIANHYVQETLMLENPLLEYFEKTLVVGVFITTAIQFRPYIRYTWILFILSFIFFLVGNISYYSVGGRNEYFIYHTIWHFGTGLVLYRILQRAEDINKT